MDKDSEKYLNKIIKKLKDPWLKWDFGKDLYVTHIEKFEVLLFFYNNKDIMIRIISHIDNVEIEEFRKIITYDSNSDIVKDLFTLREYIITTKDVDNLKKITEITNENDNKQFIL